MPPKMSGASYLEQWREFRRRHGENPKRRCRGDALANKTRLALQREMFSPSEQRELDDMKTNPPQTQRNECPSNETSSKSQCAPGVLATPAATQVAVVGGAPCRRRLRGKQPVSLGEVAFEVAVSGAVVVISTSAGAEQLPDKVTDAEEELPQSRRYDRDFWGKVGGRRRAGRPKVGAKEAADAEEETLLAQTRQDNARDLEQCRNLLMEMDQEELRRRLSDCRYNFGGSAKEFEARIAQQAVLDDRWLQEAAEAFGVAVKCTKQKGEGEKIARALYKTQAHLVEDVLVAVRRGRSQLSGDAAEHDLRRRLQLLEAMKGQGVVSRAGCCMWVP